MLTRRVMGCRTYVPRSLYSTGITPEFLKDLLDKATKATSGQPKPTFVRHHNEQGYSKFVKNHKELGQRKKYASRNQDDGKPRGKPRMKPGFKSKIPTTKTQFHPITSPASTNGSDIGITKQPQFETQSASSSKSLEEMSSSDLLDVIDLDTTKSNTPPPSMPRYERKGPKKFTKRPERKNTTGFIYMKPIVSNQSTSARTTLIDGPTNFDVPKFNPTNLLKYSSSLNINNRNLYINYLLKSMNDSNFPVYRDPNISYAKLIKDQISGPIKPNDIFTVKTPGFGKYIYNNSYSLDIKREPQLENIKVELSTDKFNEIVRGEYKGISTEKPGHLRRVEIALQNCSGLENDDKNWLLKVCSGSIPLNKI